MKELLEIISKIYEDEELRNSCIPLFLGNPGGGKTTVIKKFAESKGVNCLDIIASQLMPHEVSGMLLPIHAEKVVEYFDTRVFSSLKDGDIIFFDELLNANPMVLNACLTILENRTLISGRKLPKVMIVAAANPQGAQILTPQIKERFIWYDIKFDKSSWKVYMAKYLLTDSIFDQLCLLVLNETFNNSERNYHTPRSIEKAIKMILRSVDTPYSNKVRPILETKVLNEAEDITIGDKIWLKEESMSWLTIQKLIRNETNTK